MNDNSPSMVEQMTNKISVLDETLQVAESFVKKFYLEDLEFFSVQKPRSKVCRITYENNIRLFHIQGIVINKSEKNIDRLNNVYSALHCLGLSVAMLLDSRDGNIELYMGIRTSEDILEDNSGLDKVFMKVFSGNFPGCRMSEVTGDFYDTKMSTLLPADGTNAVTALTTLPSLKDENTDNQSFVQGLEKLIDIMQNEEFAILIISDPVSSGQVENIKQGYEELYSELYPFVETELNVGKSDSVNMSRSDIEGFTDTIGKSISKTQSFTKGKSKTKSESRTNSIGVSMGMMGNEGTSSNESKTKSKNGGAAGVILNVGGSVAKGVMSGVSSSFGLNAGGFASTAKTSGTADTLLENQQYGTNVAREESSAHTTQISLQKGLSVASTTSSTVKFENKTIKGILDCIDAHLERLKECGNYGMWSSASYFISPRKDTSIVTASAYKGILNGETTDLEQPSMNTWFHDDKTKVINQYLRKLCHPKFYDPDFKVDLEALTDITATTMLSTKELTLQCNIPYKSIPGVFVREMASFGRNVFEEDGSKARRIRLGRVYHMGNYSSNPEVLLNTDRLREHTFITGSTGSGKSNTVYEIVSRLNQVTDGKGKISTLIIEPAKGEYKQVFGDEFNVFGTNPSYTELLKINPFKFEQGIHVLEHIDRLIDIFNVCWPMYAAMPAVLKEAVEKSYVEAGWDLDTSKNKYDPVLYPNFSDVLYCLRKVIVDSDYSQEVKDNYTGSLITRVKSLTNGLNGQIFTSDEVDTGRLFKESAIVDLSRVGSSETKSMIMGILIMRLQELRMSEGGINLPLRHVTVIEEAHNLLKRTSTEQNSEGSNLLGKSVEMISNAIAEMRTYGEGFIIVDQAPGLLDMSVIRNTNTKIILRLPEYSDRELVGKSAGLSDEQIVELSKIPSGVAAVYQNKWVEPILCRVDFYNAQPKEYINSIKVNTCEKLLREEIIEYILSDISRDEPKTDVELLKDRLIKSNLPSQLKIELRRIICGKKPQNLKDVYNLVSECIENLDEVFVHSLKAKNIEEWNQSLLDSLNFQKKDLSEECRYNILECIIYKKSNEQGNDNREFNRWMEYMGRRIV